MKFKDPVWKQLLGVLFFYLMFSPLFMGGGVWTNYQIDDSDDDLWITETGSVFQTTNWIPMSEPSVGVFAFLGFRDVLIPANSSVNNAIISLRAPTGTLANETLLVTFYGIREGTLDNWSDTSSHLSLPITTSSYTYNVSNLQDSKWINFTVTNIVREIYNQYLWNTGNDMGFRIQSVPQANRWAFSFDGNPNFAPRFFINTTSVNNTVYYRGYRITPSRNGTYIGRATGTYYDGNFGAYRFIQFYQNGSIVGNYSVSGYGSRMHFSDPVMVNGAVYLLNTSGGLYRTGDFQTFTYLGTIAGTGNMGEPFGMDWAEDERTIHIVYIDGAFEVRYTNFSLVTNRLWNNGTTNELLASHGSGGFASINIAHRENNGTLVVFKIKTDPSIQQRIQDGTPAWSGVNGITLNAPWTGASQSRIRFHANGNLTIVVQGASATANQRDMFAFNYRPEFGMGTIPDDFASPWKLLSGAGDLSQAQVSMVIYPDARIMGTYLRQFGGIDYEPKVFITSRPWDVITRFDEVNNSPTMDFWNPLTTIYWDEEYVITDSNTYNAMKDRNFWLLNSIAGNWRGAIFFDQMQEFGQEYTVNELRSRFQPPTMGAVTLGGTPMMVSITHGTFVPESWTVTNTTDDTPLNNTCIQNAQTIEEIMACIDNVIGQDPQDPNPPLTDYPPDGFGVLTRFNMRFWIFVIGWVLIFAPLFAMAWRTFPLRYYPMMFIVMLTGLGLLWSLGSI